MPAKNFVMLSIDDLRATENRRHFTPLISTPNMDSLAGLATTIERPITQVPVCDPARTSVLSGLQPSRTGALDNGILWQERVSPADTLPAVLKATGVHVAMYSKQFHVHELTAQQQGVMFDRYLPRRL